MIRAGYHDAMSFFAILFALLIEQARPLGKQSAVRGVAGAWVGWAGRNFDTGRSPHAGLAWFIAVGVPTLLALSVHWLLLEWLGWPFAAVWHVAVLYLTLGFRQFSHYFTEIRDALDAGDEALARTILAKWKPIEAADLPRKEIIRRVIEHSVISAHRFVFGVFAWYSVCAAIGLGPAGAALYRMAELVQRSWREQSPSEGQGASPAVQRVSMDLWRMIDWLPCRITALGFAIVGSFEDAIDRWRQHSQRNPGDNDGVILAATSGALNVRLDAESEWASAASEAGEAFGGREPQIGHLAQVVGLVWRSVVVWMVLLALLTLAQLLG